MFCCVKKHKRASSLVDFAEEKLVFQNMSWPLNGARLALRKSPFKKISNEIILHIFRFLSVHDLFHVSLVCRSFKMIADYDEIWKFKSNTSIKLHSKSYRQIYIEWMHEKSVRNQKLKDFQRNCRYTIMCSINQRMGRLYLYPVRPANKYQFKSIGGFHQHPNLTQKLTINLSVDIDKTTPQLISLLEKASRFQEQYQQSAVLKQMIRRYYRFMQLKASYLPETLLIPTLDIEIVWQTHLLRPEMYRNDCLRLFRRIIDHSLIITNDIEQFFKEQAFFDTCQLYEQRFGEKYCSLPLTEKKKTTSNDCYDEYKSRNDKKSIHSYWDETDFEFVSNPPSDYENPFSFTEGDLILDLKWLDLCKDFMTKAMEKVSIPRSYSSSERGIDLGSEPLKRLKKSYERFLYMAAKYPLIEGNGFISPTYAIDLIWHSHMQEPLKYEADCLRLVGYVIYHDPWPIVEDKNMKKSCDQVDQIWKDEFQCEIDIDHLYNTSDNKYS